MGAVLKFEAFPQETFCANCGVYFTFTTLDRKREDGSSFYCPNGHSLSFTKSEVQRLREKNAETEKRLQVALNQRVAAEAERDRLASQPLELQKASGTPPPENLKKG